MLPHNIPQPRRRLARPARGALRLVPQSLGFCAALAVLAPARADRPLAYRLEVGDRLVYRRHATITPLDADEPRVQTIDQIQVWCLQRQADEALLLLDLTRSVGGQTEPTRAVVIYLDARGRRRFPEEIPTRLGPLDPVLDLLPTLPLGAQTAAAWVTLPDLYHRSWRCIGRGPDTECQGHRRIDFKVEDHLAIANLLGQTRAGSFWFDPVAGVVTRFESEERNRSQNTRTTVVAVLRQRLNHSPQWCARRTDEAGRFLRTLQHEGRLMQETVTRPADLARTLRALDLLWSAFKSDVDRRAASPFLALAEARRRQLRAAAYTFRLRAELGRRWLNRPARTWSLQDPTGRTITSEAARTGVVVECFWSAETTWGLRVLEPMRRLQTELTSRRVTVLCYNMDQEVERARQAIARCGRGLRHVLGGPLREVEALPALPIVRVLDQAGIVRGVWIGWQPAYTAARELALELAGPP